MTKKRIAMAGTSLGVLVAVVAALFMWFSADAPTAEAQVPNSMEARLDQIIEILNKGDDCQTAEMAIDRGMEILYGGMRVLPSVGVPDSVKAHRRILDAEMKLAAALEKYAQKGKCEEQRGRALDLKLFVEQMNEVAQAVAEATSNCGDGQALNEPDCDQLIPLLDEATGQLNPAGEPLPPMGDDPLKDKDLKYDQLHPTGTIHPSYSVKLRSPFVPRWFGSWEEDVIVTEPIDIGQCVVVFKESRGLMLKLHFDRIIIVSDPWVATYGVPRGTEIPVWVLEWIPSEYVKQWNMCNKEIVNADGTVSNGMVNTVTQRVVQDSALNYFWRFYPRNR